jgi:hypothetical protein
MTTVAQSRLFVIGVDTHARTHTYAVVAYGEHLGTEAFPNTHAGRARAIAWAARRTGGDLVALWVIEGIGSYGAQLARQAGLAGYRAVEAARIGRAGRRGIGRSDPIDAQRIAAAVLRSRMSSCAPRRWTKGSARQPRSSSPSAHIRGMADAVTTDARVDPGLLDTTRQYAALTGTTNSWPSYSPRTAVQS